MPNNESEFSQLNIHEQTTDSESGEVRLPENKSLSDIAQERINSKLSQTLQKINEDRRNGSKSPKTIQTELDQFNNLAKELTGKEIDDFELGFDYDSAKEVLGQDFLGPQEVKAAFLDQVEIDEVPPIPFTSKEIERAHELGQMLIFRAGKLKDGRSLTMQGLGEALQGKTKDDGQVIFNTDWYKGEEFFANDEIESCWALVSKNVIEKSTSKNYLEQTNLLVDYLENEVFAGSKLPATYQEAIDEYSSMREEIANIIASDWKRAAEMLANLKITELVRQTPVETVYDIMLYYQSTGERLLPDKYTWTKRRYSDGRLVRVGYFESSGVLVGGGGPDHSSPALGVVFSRSH